MERPRADAPVNSPTGPLPTATGRSHLVCPAQLDDHSLMPAASNCMTDPKEERWSEPAPQSHERSHVTAVRGCFRAAGIQPIFPERGAPLHSHGRSFQEELMVKTQLDPEPHKHVLIQASYKSHEGKKHFILFFSP